MVKENISSGENQTVTVGSYIKMELNWEPDDVVKVKFIQDLVSDGSNPVVATAKFKMSEGSTGDMIESSIKDEGLNNLLSALFWGAYAEQNMDVKVN